MLPHILLVRIQTFYYCSLLEYKGLCKSVDVTYLNFSKDLGIVSHIFLSSKLLSFWFWDMEYSVGETLVTLLRLKY